MVAGEISGEYWAGEVKEGFLEEAGLRRKKEGPYKERRNRGGASVSRGNGGRNVGQSWS